MKVALHDSDGTKYPNLALMKLAAWHKAKGDTVERFIAMMNDSYDRVYSSKVFSFTPADSLYGMGFSRVGCMPCINSNKKDIRLIATLFPERIRKISDWEQQVRVISRQKLATFFHKDTIGKGNKYPVQINEVVRWSMTRRGGQQFDMMAYFEPPTSEVCIYAGGLCE